ncbi:NAD-dependent epimerase/dehydratase family protein [Acetatifactor aquisgranensis]|uniref:NAD-dependent epimerase/dehydratase family protein n=1 Tax=Acetatifactor aquisgranensis TaxID=2941233 RepID=UPI00203E607B|nr:NAD(P)-dependent oxidoreductase [Acetatifactor aquisgranensis]
MVVLLVGGGSALMNALIDKLNKNGHRVYLLTGQRENRSSYRHVFEKYNFPYDSGSVKDILESVKPDVTVFTGAYDTNFDWETPRQDGVRYMAGLMNILSAYSVLKKGRFLYFSSQEVFGGSYIDDIKEDEPAAPKGFRAMALAQGEEICANFRKTQGTDTVILRFDRLYWVPGKGETEDNPCFRMCLEGLKTGKISANERRVFSMIYLNDAVEHIYGLICAEAPNHSCYHISSAEEIGEAELAKLIQEELGSGVQVADSTVGAGNRLVLDGSRYAGEFNQKIFNHYDTTAKRIAGFMKRHSASFITEEDAGGGLAVKAWNNSRRIFRVVFPFIENLICFIPFFLLSRMTADSDFFARLDFFLLYVLLFAVVYGQQQAIFSGFLAVIGYIAGQMRTESGFEVLVDYNTYVWMAQLFIVGLVVGYLKDQLRFIQNENRSRMQYLHGQLSDIEEINDSNVRMKHNFEAQVVNHKDSLGKIHEITSTLEQYEPEEVLFYAAQVLARVMECGDVAVYTVANGDYARLFSSTSPDARKLGNSIKYTAMEELYGELKEGRVYINRKMEDKMPMMASAVYSEDKMQLILMLWGIPWERMTLGEANRLTIVGSLIQNAVVRANRYLEALRNRRYVEGTNVLDESAFTLLERAFFNAREKGLTEYVLLEILTEGEHYEKAAAMLGGFIRQTDYLGILKGGRLCALLSNTNTENVGGIMERFRNAGYECRVEEAVL